MVPFAVIAVLLLLSTIGIVYTLEARTDTRAVDEQSPSIQLTEASAEAEFRDAVRDASLEASSAPITTAADTTVGRALDDGELFEDYVSLLVYREAASSLPSAGQVASDVRTNVSVPEVDWGDEDSVRAAIDRVDLRTSRNSNVEEGLVQATLDDVTITATEAGEQFETYDTDVNVTVGTTAFEFYDMTREYESALDEEILDGGDLDGFAGSFTARMYLLAWAESYYDRIVSPANDRAFGNVTPPGRVEVMANDAVFSTQEEVFGVSDPHSDRVMRGPLLCFASDLVDSGADFYDESQLDDMVNQTTRGRIDNVDEFCRSDLVFGDASGDMGQLNVDLVQDVILPFFQSQAADNFEDQQLRLLPIGEVAYFEMASVGAYQDYENIAHFDDFRESLNESEQYGEEYLDVHFSDDITSVDNGTPDNTDSEFGQVDSLIDEVSGELDTTTIDDVLERIYAVRPYVDSDFEYVGHGTPASELETQQPTDNHTVTRGWIEVTRDSTSVTVEEPSDDFDASNQPDDVVTVTVDYRPTIQLTERYEPVSGAPDDLEPTNETASDTFHYRATYEITGTVAPDSEVLGAGDPDWGEDVENVLERGPGGAVNWHEAEREILQAVFGSSSSGGIESNLAPDADDDVTTIGQFDDHVEPNVTENPDDVTLDAPTGLETTLEADVSAQHLRLVNESEPVNATMFEIATADPESPMRQFQGPVGDWQDEQIADVTTGEFATARELATAEARYAYYQNVDDSVDEVAQLHEDTTGDFVDSFQFELDFLDQILGRIQDGTAADVDSRAPEADGSPLLDDVNYRIDGQPTYLMADGVNRSTIPSVRPEGQGPLELSGVESTQHAPLSIRYDNAFGHPGFPLLPWPPLFYLQTDVWRVEVEGEYSRFEVRGTSGDAASTEGTTLVRESRDVEVAGVQAGAVEPINFSNTVYVVVLVPSPSLMPQGAPGVGDEWRYTGEDFYDCTPTWDQTGPGYTDPQGQSCGPVIEDVIDSILG